MSRSIRTRAVLLGVLVAAVTAVAACTPPPPNRTPTAVAGVDPSAGPAPLLVSFSDAGSSDPEGQPLAFAWDFGDGSDPEHGVTATHTYASAGTFVAELRVTDAQGSVATAGVTITVTPEPVTFASPVPIDAVPVGSPLALPGSGLWDTWGLREPGGVVYDDATATWIATYTGRGNTVAGNPAVTASIGAATSVDGIHWVAHPQNPLTGLGQAEDPYLAKDAETGSLWRDSQDRALMFTEKKSFDVHSGILLWRSAPGTLDDWTLHGEVVTTGPPGAWDSTDRTSPVVVHDDGRLVMLFEGRHLPAQEGSVGYAVSEDEGVTWDVAAQPILTGGSAGGWTARGVVPDDIVRVGETWVLLAHGQRIDGLWTPGRYATTTRPGAWSQDSLDELPGNPMNERSDTVMTWGPAVDSAVQIVDDGTQLRRVELRRR